MSRDSMHERQLYNKYNPGQHWKKHPTTYSETFANFLKKRQFSGLLVDVGCGDGRDVNLFNNSGFTVTGVDYSKEQIKADKKSFPKLSFEVQNVEHLKFKDESIDAFYMINVIHYVNKEKAIQEIYRALKHHGFLFIHFNTDIIDKHGRVDYHHETKDILKLVSEFKIVNKRLFERTDSLPVEHTHQIMELILEKL